MSYKTPSVPDFTGLYDIDKHLQELAQYLASQLTWLNYSFGLADRLREVVSESEVRIYPGAYLTNKDDPFDCHPADEYSLAFWTADDLSEVSYDDIYSVKKTPLLTYNVSLIIFANLKLQSTTAVYNELRSQLRNQIINTLNSPSAYKYGIFAMTGIVENDIRRIYEGFTYEDKFNIFKELPYYAVRINGTLSFRPGCTN